MVVSPQQLYCVWSLVIALLTTNQPVLDNEKKGSSSNCKATVLDKEAVNSPSYVGQLE